MNKCTKYTNKLESNRSAPYTRNILVAKINMFCSQFHEKVFSNVLIFFFKWAQDKLIITTTKKRKSLLFVVLKIN